MKPGDWIRERSLWMEGSDPDGIAVSSRVRLARNLADAAFPGRAGEDECERIRKRLQPLLLDIDLLTPGLCTANEDVSALERELLFERHMVSLEHARKGRGSGVLLRSDETLGVMVNEEDHLRLQAMCPGLNLREPWARVNTLDDRIAQAVPLAYDEQWGYLTACPSNVGTGMRASVMLHLPGLALLDEMEAVVKGIQKIGLAVRGLWGEGTEAHGNLFQISNQTTLGLSEEQILAELEPVVLELIDHERNARARLVEKREPLLRDQVGRATGILREAHILTSKEALDLLSALRLGIESGMVKGIEGNMVDELFLRVQPGHVQLEAGRALNPGERDQARAAMVRKRLGNPQGRTRRKKERDE